MVITFLLRTHERRNAAGMVRERVRLLAARAAVHDSRPSRAPNRRHSPTRTSALGGEEARQLKSRQHETGRHQRTLPANAWRRNAPLAATG